MAITFDVASSAGASYQGSPLSWTHTAGAGSNGIAIVWVGVFTDPTCEVTGVTYGGAAMTQLVGASIDSSDEMAQLWCYYKTGISSGAATVSVAISEDAEMIAALCTTYYGVLQSGTIFPATDKDVDVNTLTLPITTSVAIVSGEVAIGCYAATRNGGMGGTTLTDTNRANREVNLSWYSGIRCGDNLAPANPESMTGTIVWGVSDGQAVMGMASMAQAPIEKAPGGRLFPIPHHLTKGAPHEPAPPFGWFRRHSGIMVPA